MKTISKGSNLKRSISKASHCLFLLVFMGLTTAVAQNINSNLDNQISVKGLVVSEDGALPGVNVLLKGTKTGTVTDLDGTFSFPIKLKQNDVLIFQYIGYVTQEITIKENSTFIKLELMPDLVEILGTLDIEKPYKSKRKNKRS